MSVFFIEGTSQPKDPYPFETSLLGQLLCAVSLQSGAAFEPEYLRYFPHKVFYEEFPTLVNNLDVVSVAIPAKRHKPNIAGYAFVPVVAAEVDREYPRRSACHNLIVPKGIEMTYGHGYRSDRKNKPFRHYPYLDSQHAVGLVYDSWLVAVAGLIAAPRRPLTIVQLQRPESPISHQ